MNYFPDKINCKSPVVLNEIFISRTFDPLELDTPKILDEDISSLVVQLNCVISLFTT